MNFAGQQYQRTKKARVRRLDGWDVNRKKMSKGRGREYTEVALPYTRWTMKDKRKEMEGRRYVLPKVR